MTKKMTSFQYSGKHFAAMALAAALGGCAVTPQPLTADDVSNRVKQDMSRMYAGQDPITGPITLEEAVARTLKYNLDHRVKQMESALALGITDYSKFEMWPKLLMTAGYNTRNNDSGGTSVGILDGVVSLRPSTSQTRDYSNAGAEFSWSVLDFGVSYYRARQNADQYLVAEERRRKLAQNMIQDVRAAFWRALAAQRLAGQAQQTMQKAQAALVKSREAETQKIISPALALNYQRALLDAISLLNQRRQDLDFAQHELAAMMNVPAGVQFVVADTTETKLPTVPTNVRALEEYALLQRPELREEDLRKRVTADETRKQFFNVFPNLTASLGVQFNSNDYLHNKNWQQASVGLSWNLLRLFSIPDLKKSQEQQTQVDEARRLALSMAVLTQLRVAVERYRLSLEDFRLADEGAKVDQRLADYTKASVAAKLESELEVIRTESRAMLAAYQRGNAYASAQISYGRLYNSLGLDPLEDGLQAKALADIKSLVKKQLDEESSEGLKIRSQLFGTGSKISLHIRGVESPELAQRMKISLTELLARNELESAENAPALVFTLTRDTALSVDKANWAISLHDPQGRALESAEFNTKIPERSRASVLESSLLAAATSQLGTVKTWMARLDLQEMPGSVQPMGISTR
jgi:outer membrane protein TolC